MTTRPKLLAERLSDPAWATRWWQATALAAGAVLIGGRWAW
jgi:hypothetical protein